MVMVLFCYRGGGVFAAGRLVAFEGTTGHDWGALEFGNTNGFGEGVQLVRATRGLDCDKLYFEGVEPRHRAYGGSAIK